LSKHTYYFNINSLLERGTMQPVIKLPFDLTLQYFRPSWQFFQILEYYTAWLARLSTGL